MKLRKITIHNLASIEDACIDFESHPLCDSEVFLITGKTGSGKSTILDAICLALYATTPRLMNTAMQGKTNDASKEVLISDPRQMMRRNTGETYVDLLFTGSNGVNYNAHWGVKRARKKPSGNLQGKEWELTNLDTGTKLTKDDEIKPEIRAAVGLDFSQFCRTTMLAQGEFTRFLNSKDDDKASILEKITGVDIYSKIGAKIFSLTREKEALWDEAKRKLDGTTVLTAEEVEDYRTQIANIESDADTAREEQKMENARAEWIKQEKQVSVKISEAQQSLEQAIKATKSEDFEKKDKTVTQWSSTIEVREWLQDAIEAEKEAERQSKALGNMHGRFMNLKAGRLHLLGIIKDDSDAEKELGEKIGSEKGHAPLYAKAQTVEGMLNAMQTTRKKIAEQETYLSTETAKREEQLKPAKSKADNDVSAAKAELERLEKEAKELELRLEAAGLDQLTRTKESQTETLSNISTAFIRIDNYTKSKLQRENAINDIHGMEQSIEQKSTELTRLEDQTAAALSQRDMLKKLLDKQRETVDKWAKNIRQKLHVGDICPVCQQKIESALPHEETLALLYEEAEKQYNEAEKQYTDLADKKNKQDVEVKLLKSQMAKAKKALENDTSLETNLSLMEEACKKCGIASDFDNATSQLKSLEEKTQAAREETSKAIAVGKKIEEAFKTANGKVGKQRKHVEKLKETASDKEGLLAKCQNNIETATRLIEEKKADLKDTEGKLSQSIDSSLWGEDWKSEPLAFARLLMRQAKEYNDMLNSHNDIINRLKIQNANLTNVDAALTATTELMPEWDEVAVDTEEAVDKLLEKANTLRSDTQSAKEQYETALNRKKEAGDKYEDYLAQHPEMSKERLQELQAFKLTEIESLRKHLDQLRNKETTERAKLHQLRQQQEEHLQHRPEMAEDDTEEAARARMKTLGEKLNELGEKRGAIMQTLSNDEENKRKKSILLEEANRCKDVYDKWSRLCQLLGDANGNKFRKVAQSYVLASLIHSANHYMHTLSDRYQLKVSPGSFVIELEDAYQGYVSRAASTISGGESFLVSLSLALALSDIGQQLEVDTLFIDEGFGTLSGEPLQKAIDTLRSLHHKAGRHVGIISHVEELQERIPVQIRVMQEGNNSSSKVVVSERG